MKCVSTTKLAAAALLHFNCGLLVDGPDAANNSQEAPDPHRKQRCDEKPTLEIFIVRRSHSDQGLMDEEKLRNELTKWGKEFGYAKEVLSVQDVD